MFRLATRQLLLDFTRTLLTCLAIASVIGVILMLEGFELGLYSQLRQMVLNRDADLIVSQAGVSNMLVARSSLPQLSRERIEAIDEVAVAHPVTGLPVFIEKHGRKTPVLLYVYDSHGGPSNIWKGRAIEQGREVVIDHSLAKKNGLKLGDELVVSDFTFTIVGITRKEAALFMPLTFVNYDGLLDFYFESDIGADILTAPLLSFLLVKLQAGADINIAMQAIEAAEPAADVYTPAQMIDNELGLGHDMFGPVMGLLIKVGYVIGLLVVSLFMYADISSRSHSFGVLKALGFRQGLLGQTVLIQTGLLLLFAFPLGVLVALGLAGFIHWAIPLYQVDALDGYAVLRTLLAACGFALLGAWLPVRMIAHIDPQLVFKEG